ncbi:MAG: peptidyl-prolyl cis-trans isomerase [Pseudomonadota bacterium]
MAKATKSLSKTAVWILLGLLFIGLAGFGADGLTGNIRTIGNVGDKYIDVNAYANQLQQEIRAIEVERGSPLRMAEARALGVDQRVLARLVQTRALDHETTRMGLSIGDERLREELLSIPAFRGVDGNFDREGYRFSLEQAGLSEARFEETLREDSARALLQGAVVSGIVMPDVYANTLLAYARETRSFTWARLDESDLTSDIPAPDEAALQAYHTENISDYQHPRTKRIAAAVLLPDMLLDSIELDEEALRAEYDARSDIYNQPERRLVERLVFLDEAAADSALAQLDAGGATFETLVEGRGLTLADVDLGDVTELGLADAGSAVFAADVGTVMGPLPTALGPALFRVNGILPAQTVTFEEAQEELRPAMAADRARRLVDTQAQGFDDLLAGGATLEELAQETDMELQTVDWFAGLSEGLAAYPDFRQAAQAATEDDFPEIETLDDGGIFAMRLDETLPARPAPFEDVRDDVLTDWRNAQVEAVLAEQAETLVTQLSDGADFATLELTSTVEENLDRTAFVEGTPAGFMTQIFAMEEGDVSQLSADGILVIIRLDSITAADESEENVAIGEQVTQQLSQSLARDLFTIFANDTTLRAGPEIDQRAIDAVHVNFP